MSKIKYDAISVSGTYQDQNGNEKKRWTKVGVVFEGEKGLSLKLECLPINFSGWITLSEPKPKDGSSPAAPASKNLGDINDDIPF